MRRFTTPLTCLVALFVSVPATAREAPYDAAGWRADGPNVLVGFHAKEGPRAALLA